MSIVEILEFISFISIFPIVGTGYWYLFREKSGFKYELVKADNGKSFNPKRYIPNNKDPHQYVMNLGNQEGKSYSAKQIS